MGNHFQVEQIDHVELFVPDRYAAAKWYQRVLGFQIVTAFEFWAEDPRGPLMIETPSGGTKLALFVGESQQAKPTSGYHLVAFRVSAKALMDFLGLLNDLKLKDAAGKVVVAEDLADHQKAFSIYFCDPYGHRIEITTYEYDAVKAYLG